MTASFAIGVVLALSALGVTVVLVELWRADRHADRWERETLERALKPDDPTCDDAD